MSMNDLLVQGPNAPMYPMSDIEHMATVMAKSRMFGFRSVEEAMSLMLMAQAEGMHPAKAAQRYHVIQGRPALKAEAMLAGFQAAGGRIKVDEKSDKRVAVWFSHPTACPEPVLIDWTMERAKTAQLTGKDTWNKYPRQMLYARVVSEGVRTCYPGVLNGLYTPEEVVEFDDGPQAIPPAIQRSTTLNSDVPHISKAASKTAQLAESMKDKGVVTGSQLQAVVDVAAVVNATENERDSPKLASNGKVIGNVFVLIDKIVKAKTPASAKSTVTKHFNKYAYTTSERAEIANALAVHEERHGKGI